jgi:acyl carrier protein
MVPSVLVEMSALPLTPNGKVDRNALPAAESPQAVPSAFVVPRTQGEELLAGIWAVVLKVPRVGAFDDFFELGGHSLLATQVMTRVRDAFQVELPLRRIFEARTVAQLCEVIEQARSRGLQRAPRPIASLSRDSHRIKTGHDR